MTSGPEDTAQTTVITERSNLMKKSYVCIYPIFTSSEVQIFFEIQFLHSVWVHM